MEKWTEMIIAGRGGFRCYEDREFVVFRDRDVSIADFVIGCLCNPNCEGTDELIKFIQNERARKRSIMDRITRSRPRYFGPNGPTGHGDICHSDADPGL